MMIVNYPKTLPIESLGIIFKRLKNNDQEIDNKSFAIAIWNIQGFLLSKLIDETIPWMQPRPITDSDAIDCINELIAPPEEEGIRLQYVSIVLLVTLLKWSTNKLTSLIQ